MLRHRLIPVSFPLFPAHHQTVRDISGGKAYGLRYDKTVVQRAVSNAGSGSEKMPIMAMKPSTKRMQ